MHASLQLASCLPACLSMQMIKETFGDMLYVSESESMPEFPSPDDLKGRVIISTKPPKEYLQTKSSKEEAADEKAEEGVWGEEISDDKATARQARTDLNI